MKSERRCSAGQSDDPEVAGLLRKIGALQVALDASETARQELLDSTSWRITAPIRWLRRRLSGSKAPLLTSRPNGPGAGRGVAAFPATLRAAPGDRPDGPNDSFHPLDLDQPLAMLLPDGATELAATGADGLSVGVHLGSKPAVSRIAFLGGGELAHELAFDAAVTVLHFADWRAQLQAIRHDYLMLESAWIPAGEWKHGLVGVGPEADSVRELIASARDSGLPVVLWLREDATNIGRYAWLFELVDIVYAVDVVVAARVRRDCPGRRVETLPPAVQPAIHNPVRSYHLRDAAARLQDRVLLDGWWDLTGGAATGVDLGSLRSRLLVAESEWDVSRVRIDDLPSFSDDAIGCVTPLEKAMLSRVVPAELFLEKGLLPAWRRDLMMCRAAACGALVAHLGRGSEILQPTHSVTVGADGVAQPLSAVLKDPLARAKRAHLAFRHVLSGHCLADRLATIAAHLGLPAQDPHVAAERVAVLLVTMRPQRLEQCIGWFRREKYRNKELIVLVHGDADLSALRRLVLPGEPITFLQLGSERSLGDCLNFAIAHTDAPYWVKMDDDDHYGANYLRDMMLYRKISDAPIFGKPPVFLHLEAGDELRWDPVWAQHANLLHTPEEATSALIAGGTLGGRREVLADVRFSGARRGGSDSDFVRRCYEQGHSVLATDGFNFARFRSADSDFHTWRAPVAELRERAVVVGSGADLESHAFI